MNNLSPIFTLDDFEETVFVRAMLSRLETPQIQSDFEDEVLRKVKAGTPIKWAYLSVALAAIATGVMLWWSSTPNVVIVSRVPDMPTNNPYYFNLENLPPAPYHEYTVDVKSKRAADHNKLVHPGKAVSGY